jgi:hypothetical protein
MSTETEKREDLRLDMNFMDLMMAMSEGNPGALRVCMELVKSDPLLGPMWLIHLDDMNIRGTQIWIGYKDYCGEKLEKFITCIKERSQAMVDLINAEGRKGNHTALAVTSGGSHLGGRKNL